MTNKQYESFLRIFNQQITTMKKTTLLIIFIGFVFLSSAQTIIQKDPEIEQMLKEVSADSLRSYINALVGVGTRNTLSAQTAPKYGIGAARNWVLSKFNEF